MKVVIIGGVAGGASAAARLRRLDEQAEIVVLERSGYVSYANCGLPYFVGGSITDRAKLTLQTPASFRDRFDIDVRVNNEAVEIDRDKKEVLVRNLADGTVYTEPYDKLILSPGARALVPAIPGTDAERLFTLRTVEDTFAIYDFAEREKPATAAVIGGGFIGVEMAENLVERGIEVALYQRPGQVLPILDSDMVPFVHNEMRAQGIDLHLGSDVQEFQPRDGAVAVRDQNGVQDFGMVVLAIGVVPESSLAEMAGLELGVKGAIVVDEHMRTADPDVYAVGDAVQVTNYVSHDDAHIALAGPANKQGRIAADNICGLDSVFMGSQGSSVIKVFGLTAASTGLTARAAQRAGIDYDDVLLSPPSHASYYPGSHPVRLKVLFERGTGRIIGGQAVGVEGVDKRIDVLATAIHANMTADDLAELDLCYAPPYSSAKDPVNMAGFMIQNILEGRVDQVHWADALDLPADTVLLDVRTAGEHGRGCVEGAIHIPVDELRGRIGELPQGKRLFVHCQTGLRSYLACRMLAQLGYDCANVAGGYVFLEAARTDNQDTSSGVGGCGL